MRSRVVGIVNHITHTPRMLSYVCVCVSVCVRLCISLSCILIHTALIIHTISCKAGQAGIAIAIIHRATIEYSSDSRRVNSRAEKKRGEEVNLKPNHMSVRYKTGKQRHMLWYGTKNMANFTTNEG